MANDTTTPITSIAPDHLELFKAYLTYRDVKQQLKKYKKQPKYRITIELSISSNSEEYSVEDELESENETDEHTEPEFTDDEVQKDTEDVENSLKKCCA
jgi:hypothetical protein